MLRLVLVLVLFALSAACSHPLEIVGEGDIVSSTGQYDCNLEEQPCTHLVIGGYDVTYSAVAREGWHFVRWEGCGPPRLECTFDVDPAVVKKWWNKTAPTLRAVFAEGPPRPNILLIIADDLAYDHYGFAGHPVLQTPSIDLLAAQSVHYPNAYVSGTCRPTQATLLTGQPEHVHGVTYIEGPPLANLDTIAGRLTNTGYTTLQAGKFWEASPASRGFSGFVSFDSPLGNLSFGRGSIQPLLDLVNQSLPPWFVWLSPNMPHRPHEAQQGHTDLYQGLGLDAAVIEYFAMVSWFDDVVGAVLQGVPENTVVIYLADNGYLQSPQPELYLPKSKASSYEYGIRTPLLIRHGDHPPADRDELASAVDVAATILSIAGAYHDDLPGRDVLAPAPPLPRALGSESILYGAEAGVLRDRWVRRENWKLVDVEEGEDRLFDLDADPQEEINLINAPEWSALRDELQAELEAWWVSGTIPLT